jgi:hypothetical protein
MADKEPGAGKHLLLFLLIDGLIDKDFAADLPGFQVD